jgi:arsenite methyltransferase
MVDSLDITPGSTIVDLGAGSGAYVYEACRVNGPHGRVIAVDIDKEKLEMVTSAAKIGGYKVDTLIADLDKKIILPDYVADYVVLANTLHMIDNKVQILKECARILSPNGYMLLVDWNSESNLGPKDVKLERAAIVASLAAARLRVRRELAAGDHHFAYIIEPLK